MYTDMYERILKSNPTVTLTVYEDIIMRGSSLPYGYIESLDDIAVDHYINDYRYYRSISEYKTAVYEWRTFRYESLYDTYVFSKFKADCLKRDEYGNMLYSYLFSTILCPDIYTPSPLIMSRWPSILDRPIFEAAIVLCSVLPSTNTAMIYADLALYRLLKRQFPSEDIYYFEGYRVYRTAAYSTHWVQVDDTIYDIQSIHYLYSTMDKHSVKDIAAAYVSKSIHEGYYYSKSLYQESNVTVETGLPSAKNPPSDIEQMLHTLVTKCENLMMPK